MLFAPQRWQGPLLVLAVSVPAVCSQAHAASLSASDLIQPAIDAAAPGEVITLAPGTYAQSFKLRDGITLNGAGIDQTVITGVITVPSNAVSGSSISQLTGRELYAAGHNFSLHDAAFTGTVYFEGVGVSTVADTTFRSFVVGRGEAQVTHTRVRAKDAAFSWEQARVVYEDSVLERNADLQASSHTTFRRCQLTSATLVADARGVLEESTSSSSISARGRGIASILASTIGGASWAENGFITLEDSTVGRAQFTISAGVTADLIDVGAGTLASANGSSSTGFGAAISNTRIDDLGMEIFGTLNMLRGGFDGYVLVYDGATARFEGVTTNELARTLGNSQTEFIDSTLNRTIEVWGQSAVTFTNTLATSGIVDVTDDAEAVVRDGSSLQLQLRGNGAARVQNAVLSKLSLYVSEGRIASIDGLTPGVSTGIPSLAGSTGGPTLELDNGELKSLDLYVHGQADISNSTIDGYTVVEHNGIARFDNALFQFAGVFRGNARVTCNNCRNGSFLTVADTTEATFTGGTLKNYADFRNTSISTLTGVTLNATLETKGTSTLNLVGCSSSSNAVWVTNTSRLNMSAGSEQYALHLFHGGWATVADSHVGTVRFEVGSGYDLVATGLKPGLLTGSVGPAVQGPRLSASAVQVDAIEILNKGTISVADSELNGYAFMYENSKSTFSSTILRGPTVMLSSSVNEFIDSTLQKFEANGTSINRFMGCRFPVGASLSFNGTSKNTFTRCVFERGLTLSGNSTNNFGEIAGTNPGDNDFSAAGSSKLSNFTPNRVMAQNCFWGVETAPEIALSITDQVDNAAYGKVEFEPFIIRNRPPVVSAGDDRLISSHEQESLVLMASAIDPEGDLLTYRWLEGTEELLGASPVDFMTGESPLDFTFIPFLADGEHRLTLEVMEPSGRIVTDDVVLVIGNSAPVVTPSGAGTFGEGNPIYIGGEVADYDGDLLTYTWWLGEELLLTGSVQAIVEGTSVLLEDRRVPRSLGLGKHVLTLEVDDGVNAPTLASLYLEVVDRTPPTLSPVVNPGILWPPNKQLVDVEVRTYAMDATGLPVTLSARVSSNESSLSRNPDWTQPVIDQTTGVITLQLRAERNVKGTGRIYEIAVTATDAAGNQSESRVEVKVPRWGFEK